MIPEILRNKLFQSLKNIIILISGTIIHISEHFFQEKAPAAQHQKIFLSVSAPAALFLSFFHSFILSFFHFFILSFFLCPIFILPLSYLCHRKKNESLWQLR